MYIKWRVHITKYFAICPVCGKRLLKAENGSTIEIQCPECKIKIDIEIENGVVKTKSITSIKENDVGAKNQYSISNNLTHN